MSKTSEQKSRISLTKSLARAASVALVVGVAIAAPAAPAGAAVAKVPCDEQAGKTLLANQTLRMYKRPVGQTRQQLRVCAYRTKRDVSLSPEGPQRTFKDLVYTLGGNYAAAIQRRVILDKVTNDPSGVELNSSLVWDGKRGRFVGEPEMPSGVRFASPVLSKSGVIAAIGDPVGLALPDDSGGPARPLSESAVYVSNAAAREPWRPIGVAPAGQLRDLVLSGESLVWWSSDSLASAPLIGPIASQ